MKAAVIEHYGPPEVLHLGEAPEPICGPRDVLIEVHASSVNPIDTKIRRGGMRGVIHYRLPWVLGLDVSGVVKEVGSKVTRFRPGDEVYSSPTHRRSGCYAELVAIDERAVGRKPKNISHGEAAGIPLAGITAWMSVVEKARAAAGKKILVHAGAGGVGSLAIQIAKHFGAHVATTASARNTELVASLGADEIIDYTKQRYDELLSGFD